VETPNLCFAELERRRGMLPAQGRDWWWQWALPFTAVPCVYCSSTASHVPHPRPPYLSPWGLVVPGVGSDRGSVCGDGHMGCASVAVTCPSAPRAVRAAGALSRTSAASARSHRGCRLLRRQRRGPVPDGSW
jgi:hypothetical protein